HRPFHTVCDASRPPFANWFVGGQTNLCHNAVDRHLAQRAEQNALIWVSTEVGDERGEERIYSFRELHAEVQRMAACLLALGVQQGDRVLIYMPMIPQAVFAMLACARIGAIHSVVFGGFASASLASRIDDATPRVIVSADAGSRAGKVIAYKPLLDEAIRLAAHPPEKVLLVDRGLATMPRVAGRDEDYAALRERHLDSVVPCAWLPATHPSYTLYTSGTTGRPKGVQRDTGGYAVALAASMKHIFCCQPGETYFSTSDIGWVVGHSYIVYGPLIAGMATILYEGLPVRPDAGIWWRLVEKYRVTAMFSAPTAVRVLKKHDEKHLREHDLSSLRALFLAGEPLDEPTASWIANALGKPVIDNYWQTESGWPILTIANGVESRPSRYGSPGVAMYGYDVKLIDEVEGTEITGPGRKGVLAIAHPLPPGCMQTVWRDDERFVNTYWKSIPGQQLYSTFDWGVRDADGYYFILGRTDDVINVAGHRLGTREIEETIASHANVAEVAVVGVADALKGQVAIAFVVAKDASGLTDATAKRQLEGEIMKTVDQRLGALARPARVHIVTLLPKTRSGKLLRRAIQAVCEQRDPGDLTTMDDPAALQQIRDCVGG
ncbi:MAG TPA: propionate--CoA ligase, partial [Burkholderiaceae bacterium]